MDPFNDGLDAILSQVLEPNVDNAPDDYFFNEIPIGQQHQKQEFDDDLDLVLSQVADEMEREYECTESLADLSISQCVAEYLPNFFLDFNSENNENNTCNSKRFGEPARKEDKERLVNSQKNPNTERNTKWALEVFLKWKDTRNKDGENIPLLKDMNAETMNSFL